MSGFKPYENSECLFSTNEWSIDRVIEIDEADGSEIEYLFIANAESESVWSILQENHAEFMDMIDTYSNSEILDHLIASCEGY